MRSSRVAVLAMALATTLLAVPAAGPFPAAAADRPRWTSPSTSTRGWARVPTPRIGVNHAVWDTELGTDADADLMQGRRRAADALPRRFVLRHLPLADHTAPGGYVAPEHRLRHLHGAACGAPARSRWSSPTTAPARPQEAAGLGPLRQRHQGVRREVLGDRQRELRQRPLRQRAGRPTTTPTRARPRTPTSRGVRRRR